MEPELTDEEQVQLVLEYIKLCEESIMLSPPPPIIGNLTDRHLEHQLRTDPDPE